MTKEQLKVRLDSACKVLHDVFRSKCKERGLPMPPAWEDSKHDHRNNMVEIFSRFILETSDKIVSEYENIANQINN